MPFTFRLAFGNESGLAIVDYVQKTCLLNLGTPDLYGKENQNEGFLGLCLIPKSYENTILISILLISF